MRALVPYLGDGAHSQAERVLHQLLRRAGLTGWRANYPVTISARRYVIDVAFPAQQIAVEVDGYRTHSQPDSFQGDRTKGVVLSTAGWTMLRFTWSDLVDRADYVVAAISSLLAA